MLDIASIIGMVAGTAVIIAGILIAEGATLMMFWDPPSVFITIGGAFCATLICYPLGDFKELAKVLMRAFVYRNLSPVKIIKDFRRFADIARRDGILALENVTGEIDDPFLVKGIQLAVDGTDPEVIQTMMQTELDQMQGRHDKGIQILKRLASYGPSYGMIGTLIGLVIMLANLSDPSTIGSAMAVAIITTFYGALMAYLIAEPLAVKLERRSNDEVQVREMIIRGVMSIQSGDNPRIVEQKLKIFLPPHLRELQD
jgi:chemotaxis protein MotA